MARVLIVDDNQNIARAIGRLVQRAGFEAMSLESGPAALEHLRSDADTPDIIILDEMMPDMDGLAVLREIRGLPRTSTTPVIMFTAMYDKTFAARAKQAGASDVWIKGSFDIGKFASEISRHLSTAG